MIISLITGSSIYQKGLASAVPGACQLTSKVQRIYRFLKEFTFDYIQVTKLILRLFGQTNYIMAMDRTSWKFGKNDVNILFLAIVIGNISVPISWRHLPHSGACSAEFMQQFLQKFIDNFTVNKIRYLLADREFMNIKWLNFLTKNNIQFVVPLKSDNKIRLKQSLKKLVIGQTFKDIKPLEYKGAEGVLWGHKVHFAAYRNEKNELMVLVASLNIEADVFSLYQFRWSIERLFKCLKSSGFDIERSQLIHMDRFEKLLVVAGITTALIVKNGLIQSAIKPIRIKRFQKVETALFSIFTYGFDHIKSTFYSAKKIFAQLMRNILKPPNEQLLATLLPISKKM